MDHLNEQIRVSTDLHVGLLLICLSAEMIRLACVIKRIECNHLLEVFRDYFTRCDLNIKINMRMLEGHENTGPVFQTPVFDS